MSKVTTLGVSPGAKTFGLAIMRNGVLLHWQMRKLPGTWSDTKLHIIRNVINKNIKNYDVTNIAVRIPDELPTSKAYIQIVGLINILAENDNLEICYYTLSNLKLKYTGTRESNIMELIETLIRKYPELLPEYCREKKNRNSYYRKLFEAVAVSKMK